MFRSGVGAISQILETSLTLAHFGFDKNGDKLDDIDAAVFDLKAVNPNVVAKVDTRTPTEIIANIEAQGKIVSDAMGKLRAFIE